jgi:glutathione S-transferase
LAARIDQFIDFLTDLNSLISFSGKDVSEEQKLLNRKNLASGEFKRKLGILEDNISESDPWVTGSEISIADIAIWRTMGWMVSGTVDGFPKNLLEEFPNIKRVCKSVDTHPKVLEWISLTYPKNYSRGSF